MPSIAHYNLLEPIGTGGLGEVFRARDTKVGRTVALKLLSAERRSDPARLERLLEDARQAATVSHPNIATLWDVGEGDGQIYLAYEFAAGRRLRDETGGVAMNPRRALDLAIQIADGVSEAHSRGILHGDLRPDTIMVTAKGNAKVLDCGMAPWTNGGAIRAAGAASPDRLPQEAVSVLAYLSPEQAIAGGVDARTDVFSLGILTYEMLTGRNPFLGATPADTIINVIQGRFTPPSEVNPAVPQGSRYRAGARVDARHRPAPAEHRGVRRRAQERRRRPRREDRRCVRRPPRSCRSTTPPTGAQPACCTARSRPLPPPLPASGGGSVIRR